MKLVEKNIEWFVAIALTFGCIFDVVRQSLYVLEAEYVSRIINIFYFMILFCLLIYQAKHYKIGLKKSPYILFFVWYCFYIFVVYGLQQLLPNIPREGSFFNNGFYDPFSCCFPYDANF